MLAETARKAALAAVLLLTPGLLPASARAWCQMTTSDLRPTAAEPCILAANHPGEHPLAWRRRCTSMVLSTQDASADLSDADVRLALSNSIGAWEAVRCSGGSPGLDVQLLSETTVVSAARHFSNGRNVNAVIFVHEGWATERSHDPLALAVTYVWHDPNTGEIFDADIELNEDTNTFVVCPEAGCTFVPADTADLENTLTHEMGHYFGIAHSPDDMTATMWARADPGEVIKRSLAPDDQAALCGIYPSASLPNTCDYTPRGGLGLDGTPPSGCSVSRAGSGARTPRSLVLVSGAIALSLALRRRRSPSAV